MGLFSKKSDVESAVQPPFGKENDNEDSVQSDTVEAPPKVSQVKDSLKQVIDNFEEEAKKPKGNVFQRFGLIFSSCINFFPKPLRYLMSFVLGAAPLALMLIPGVNLLIAAVAGSILSAFAWCSLASVTEIQSLYKNIILNEIAQLRVLYETIVRLESVVLRLEGISNHFEQQLAELSGQNQTLGKEIQLLKGNNQVLTKQLEQLEEKNNQLGEKIEHLEQVRLGLAQAKDKLAEEIQGLMSTIIQLRGEREAFTKVRDALEEKVQELSKIRGELDEKTLKLDEQIMEIEGNNQFLSHQVKVLQLMTQQFVEQFPNQQMQEKFMQKIESIINDKAEMKSILGNLEQLEKALSEINDENHELAEQLSEVITSLQNLKQHEARNQLLRQTLVESGLNDSERLDKVRLLLVQRQFENKLASKPTSPTQVKTEHAAQVVLMWQRVQEKRRVSSSSGLSCIKQANKKVEHQAPRHKRAHTFHEVCTGCVEPEEYLKHVAIG